MFRVVESGWYLVSKQVLGESLAGAWGHYTRITDSRGGRLTAATRPSTSSRVARASKRGIYSAHPLLRADWLPTDCTAQAVSARGPHQGCAPSKAIAPGPTTTASPSRRCGGSGSSCTTAQSDARVRL